jgi:hypothetical protein
MEDKTRVLNELLTLLDRNKDGMVSHDEWTVFRNSGRTLPDLNTGIGIHHDDEMEYELSAFARRDRDVERESLQANCHIRSLGEVPR